MQFLTFSHFYFREPDDLHDRVHVVLREPHLIGVYDSGQLFPGIPLCGIHVGLALSDSFGWRRLVFFFIADDFLSLFFARASSRVSPAIQSFCLGPPGTIPKPYSLISHHHQRTKHQS